MSKEKQSKPAEQDVKAQEEVKTNPAEQDVKQFDITADFKPYIMKASEFELLDAKEKTEAAKRNVCVVEG